MRQLTEEILKNSIPEIRGCSQLEEIEKGYSSDRKFRVETAAGEALLLRVADIASLERKEREYGLMQGLADHGVRCPRAIAVGTIPDINACYLLLTYIEGTDASERLPQLSEEEQYQVGLEAGRDLRRIHRLEVPEGVTPWGPRAEGKYRRYLEAYRQSGVRVKNDETVEAFIEANIQRIMGRPNVFQHDDFHVGNLIVAGTSYAGVIDFNRFDWGDPVHEFYKVAFFSREVSLPFCRGQILGYYDNQVPEGFWPLYSVYVAMMVFSSVAWSAKVDPEGLEDMVERACVVLDDHDRFDRVKPNWYRG